MKLSLVSPRRADPASRGLWSSTAWITFSPYCSARKTSFACPYLYVYRYA